MAEQPTILARGVAASLGGPAESWIRRMFEAGRQLRAESAEPVHDLSLGNPSLEPPTVWREAVHDLLSTQASGMHRYMSNAGFPEVRAFIAEREGIRAGLPVRAEEVVMTVGAAGALNVLFRAMLDPGDEVIVPAPYFSEYPHYCANVGARLVPVATSEGFDLDPDAIAAALGPRTRIVLLNSPNNPTGAVYSAAVLEALARVLERDAAERERPVFVLEDSPYRDLMHDESVAPSLFGRYPHTVLVTSHSKDLGLAGERIGYLVISPDARGHAALAQAAGYCNRILGFVNAPALMQRVLPRVLADPAGRVNVAVYAQRCQIMAHGLRQLGFEVPPPRAGFFLFPRLPEHLRGDAGGDVALTDRLLAARTVVVPGTAFGVPDHLRLSMATDEAAIAGALEVFQRVCA